MSDAGTWTVRESLLGDYQFWQIVVVNDEGVIFDIIADMITTEVRAKELCADHAKAAALDEAVKALAKAESLLRNKPHDLDEMQLNTSEAWLRGMDEIVEEVKEAWSTTSAILTRLRDVPVHGSKGEA